MSLNPTRDEFAAMFDSSFGDANMGEGKVVAATILSLENDFAVLDVGLKTEGRVPLREFGTEAKGLVVGATVEVYLDRIENALGEAVVSREKARREEAWTRLVDQYLQKASKLWVRLLAVLKVALMLTLVAQMRSFLVLKLMFAQFAMLAQ